MSQRHTLFVALQVIANNCHIDIPVDEAEFVSVLYKCVQKHAFLKELYKDTLKPTSQKCTEAHLPLFARMIRNTVGVVDSNHDVVHIPHQWFAVGDDNEDYPEIIKAHTDMSPVSYSIDFDEDYSARYIEQATEKQ